MSQISVSTDGTYFKQNGVEAATFSGTTFIDSALVVTGKKLTINLNAQAQRLRIGADGTTRVSFCLIVELESIIATSCIFAD